MTREEFDKWSYERCPGGTGHEGNDDWGYWKSDCHECQWELLRAEIAKERERCARICREVASSLPYGSDIAIDCADAVMDGARK